MDHKFETAADFPPITTEAWEAQIARDLKGIDYEKRLVWKTDEGIAVRPYYRSEHATPRAPLSNASGTWEFVAPGGEPALSASAVEAHEGGATPVQEVAFVLAQGADLLAAGRAVTTIGFAIGSNHFMEIAKLRAARLLWPQVAAAFGVDGHVRIHARTAGENKTLYDPYVNLLRVTTEAMSAVLGGCDSLTITPCGFDAHLADNVHHILREESHLDKVLDPGAGSYYLEALTGSLAADAWALFQAIEASGGWAAYRLSGTLRAALDAARKVKDQAVAERRRVLVGTNNYPNIQERELRCRRRPAARVAPRRTVRGDPAPHRASHRVHRAHAARAAARTRRPERAKGPLDVLPQLLRLRRLRRRPVGRDAPTPTWSSCAAPTPSTSTWPGRSSRRSRCRWLSRAIRRNTSRRSARRASPISCTRGRTRSRR